MAEFAIDTTSEWITIEGIRFAPAEADALKSAVSFAGGMRRFSKLPPSIDFEQFTVQFFDRIRLEFPIVQPAHHRTGQGMTAGRLERPRESQHLMLGHAVVWDDSIEAHSPGR